MLPDVTEMFLRGRPSRALEARRGRGRFQRGEFIVDLGHYFGATLFDPSSPGRTRRTRATSGFREHRAAARQAGATLRNHSYRHQGARALIAVCGADGNQVVAARNRHQR